MNLRDKRQILIRCIYIFVLLTLVSCGQKGDLYLPDKTQTASYIHRITS